MKTYLVTGGCGFIGANFIHYMFRKYGEQIRILNLDKLTYAGDPKNLADLSDRANYTFIKGEPSRCLMLQGVPGPAGKLIVKVFGIFRSPPTKYTVPLAQPGTSLRQPRSIRTARIPPQRHPQTCSSNPTLTPTGCR